MPLSLRASFLLFVSTLTFITTKAQFTPGNVTVLQVDASANNTTAGILELTATGVAQTPVTTVGIDGGSATGLRFSGSASSTAYLANSNDGTLLCITGVNTTATSGNLNAVLTRGVATLDINQIYNLAATYTGASGNQARCATTLDNTTYFIADQGGFYTNNAASPSPNNNFREVKAFGGTVYVGLTSGSSVQVSTISAPSGGTITGLPGLGANGSLQDFYFLSSGSNGTTYDILYVVSSTADNAGTINKYSLVSGTWTANGSYTTTFGGYGLAAKTLTTGGAELYVSTGAGALTGNSVLKCTDVAGYNAALNITTADNITLYTAPAAKIVKGVALAPIGTVTATPPTVSLTVSTNTASEANQTAVTVTATTSAPVTGNQSVTLSINGTGITAGDYTLSNTTITIPNGATSGSVTFTIVDDNTVEGLETATLSIGSPTAGLTLGSPTSQAITIQDNDVSPKGMRITEFMYSGNNGEFVEFTNVGATAIDMTGWSYNDNAAIPGAVSLSAFGTVQPGESVILTETDAAAFRTDWNLCNGAPVIGGNTTNIGRSDQINLYDNGNNLVDRITYGDQTFSGTIRTQDISGYVTAAAMGVDSIAGWRLSSIGDPEGSVTSTGGDIGSPGRSTRATVSFNPCATVPNAPAIVIDVANTANSLDGGATTSPSSPYAVSGVLNDPTDPASTTGIYFTISDPNIPVGNLTLTATSSNTSVVPLSGLSLTGSLASWLLKITPTGVGYSNITLTVNNGTLTSTYTILYAASQSASTSLHWPTGIADASDAIALSDSYMAIGDDEVNKIFVFNRSASGLPVTTFDYNQNNVLNLTDGSPGNYKELDIEAATPSPTVTGRTYWVGSMSNSSTSFGAEPNRDRVVAVNISGSVETSDLAFANAGYAAGLRAQLITWGDANGYDFTDAAAVNQNPKAIDGFNIEGAVFAPDNTTLYFGFRAPLVPTTNRTMAVIAPLLNFETWFNNGNPTGNATFGAPIQLDLGGRGIRDIIRLSNGTYVIAAGMYDGTSNPAIFTWTGNAGDPAVAQPSFDVTGLNVEGLMGVNTGGLLSLDHLQIITDNGSDILYNDGTEAKDLTEANFQKFSSSVSISSDPVALPVAFETFTAQRETTNVRLDWTTGIAGSFASFTVTRSSDGAHFSALATIPAGNNQTAYTWIDQNAPATRVYYRIQANELSGQTILSTIRVLDAGNSIPAVQVYPNPVINGAFTLTIPGSELKTVSIYNSTGAIIQQSAFTETAKDYSTAGWAKGYYLLRIVLADGSTDTEKIIVQ